MPLPRLGVRRRRCAREHPALADERCPRRRCRTIRATCLTASFTCGPATERRAGGPDLPTSVVADKSLRGLETLSRPPLTETREWEGVPWHSAVEITGLHAPSVRSPEHPGWQGTSARGRSERVRDARARAERFRREYVRRERKGGGRVTFVPPSTVMNESFFVDETSSDGKKAFPLCFVFRFVPVAPGRTAILVQTHQKLFPHASDALAKALMNMTKVMSQDQLVLAGHCASRKARRNGTFPSSPTSILCTSRAGGWMPRSGRTVVPRVRRRQRRRRARREDV